MSCLILFPYAGGSKKCFKIIERLIGDNSKVITIDYDNKSFELDKNDVVFFIKKIVQFLKKIDDDIIFFGHSLGAIIAYECALAIPDNKCKKLIVSSCLPPKLFMKKLMSSGNIDDLVEQLISNDAVPSVIKENDMVTENTRNRIKNHISILQDYKVNRSKELDIPICAISSHRDLIAPYKDMKLWCDYTCNYFTHQLVFGDHFYFRENSRLIDKIV